MIAGVTTLPRNDQLAEQFELLADLMELASADSFRIGAYRKAAARIRETSTSVAQLALEGKATKLQGIGKTIEGKIVEAVNDGEVHALTKKKAEVPAEVAVFMGAILIHRAGEDPFWPELAAFTGPRVTSIPEVLEVLELC